MNLKKLQSALTDFRLFLETESHFPDLFIYESQKIWRERWDVEAIDFGKMYDQSLQNSQSRRLWVGENFFPKEMMLKFTGLQKEYVRLAFRDLFNESKDISGRMDRFIFYCDELLGEYKSVNPKSIENRHFHDENYHMISLYLAFEFPENYTFYDLPVFQKMLAALAAPDIPQANDAERYFKVMRTIFKFMQKDETLLAAHQKRLDPTLHYADTSLLLCWEFGKFLAER